MISLALIVLLLLVSWVPSHASEPVVVGSKKFTESVVLGEIDVDNRDGQLQPGMFTSVRILVGESREATLVPVTALWEDPVTGQRGVFVVEETSGLVTPEEATTDSPEFYDDARIDALRLSTGERTTVFEGASFARWLPTGRSPRLDTLALGPSNSGRHWDQRRSRTATLA